MAHDLKRKADAYGIESRVIDGFDITALYDDFKPFVDILREEQRPGFVDLKTYRYQGHSMSDPQKYRTKEEVEGFKAKDSMDALAAYLMNERKTAAGGPSLTEQQFMEMQTEVKEVVRHALEFAEQSPVPDPATELYSDVYVNPAPNLSPSGEYVHGVKNPLL
jgi:pyruvate dehydrogenase E1 component alpha subunit